MASLLQQQKKIALITGAGGTIGKAIAKALLSHNFSLILTARRLSKLEETKRELLEEATKDQQTIGNNNNTIHVIPCDISNEDSVVKLFQTIDELEDCKNGVDILVNNAGVNTAANTFEDLTAADMEFVLGVNVVGAFLCAREAMKRMKRREDVDGGRGRIINVGSISATSPRPNSIAYTTSKFALDGLSKSLSVDGRPHNIAVGTIHPGNVISDLLPPEEVKARSQTEGWLRPEDVAECVLTMAKLPFSANVLDMTVIPTGQPFVGRG